MGKGHATTVQCAFCGRSTPRDRASKMRRFSFSVYDERAGIKHRGAATYEYACPKCARRRGVKDSRQRQGGGSRKAKKRY